MGQDAPGSGGLPPTVVGGLGPGSQVAGYRLEERIGRGGMAVVFRARDERLGRPVALKVLAPELAEDAGFRQRFLRESRVAAAVDDPHVIPVFEAGEADGVLFIAMRLVRGGDVRSLLAAQRPLEPGRACGMVSAVASALDAAHADGLVHRDVTPANMLLDARPGRPDHVYLADFGLGKAWQGSTGLTRSGGFLGTPDYAAPEQIEGRPVDGRADQYALGCVAFELLSGEPPFRRQHALATINAHLSAPPPRLTGRRPGLPSAVDEVFAKVLAKSPGERFGSCGEFAGALRSALDAPGSPPTPPPARRRRRRIWVAAASGAAVVVAAVVAVFALSGKPSLPTPVVSIGASSSNPPVGGDVYVTYQYGKYAGATISGNISRAVRGEVARLTAQRFPFTSAPVVVRSSQITGKSQRVSFGVAPTLATRYQIQVFGSPSATTPMVRSAVQPVYVATVFGTKITQNRTCSNRCTVTIRLRFIAPPAALQAEAAKHVYFYFAVNLSRSSTVAAPKTLYLQTNYTLSAPTVLSSNEYQQILSFWYASHNENTRWNWFACTRDTESADGIGLPGYHGCGNSAVTASVRSRGYIG